MPFFEGFRRRAAANVDAKREQLHESLARAGQAEAELSVAECRKAYAQARLTELLPDLREEARLDIEMRKAEARLQRAHEMRPLAQQALALHRRIRREGPELDAAIKQDTAAAEELGVRKREHTEVIRALENVRTRIQERDTELRLRFGLD